MGIDFEAVLAGIACSADDDGSCLLQRLEGVEHQLLAGQRQHFLHDGLSQGTLHSQFAILVALVLQRDVVALGLLLNPCPVLIDVGSIDDEEEAVFRHLIYQQVIHHATVVIAHHAIENLSGVNARDVVGEDVVDKTLGIGTTDQYLAHVTDVKDAAGRAYCLVLVHDSRILNRHVEASEW